MIGDAMIGGAVGSMTTFRYRCEYLHVPTSARIIFTVAIPVEITGDLPREVFFLSLGSAGEAMAKRRAAKWIEETGLGPDAVMLGVVAVTDKMSVRVPVVRPIDDMGDDC